MTSRRIIGLIGMIVAVLGIVLSIILIGVTWYGQGVINRQVALLISGVDGGLVRIDGIVGQLNTQIQSVQSRITQVSEDATRASQSGTLDQAVVNRLASRIDRDIGSDYARVRELYGSLSERVAALIDLADRLRAIPFVSIPDIPTEQLQAVDQRLREFDATMLALQNDLATPNLGVSDAVGRIGERTAKLAEQIGTLTTALTTFQGRLSDIRTALSQTVATVQGWITLASVLLTLLWLYLGFLHVVLFLQGRRWYRPAPAAPAPVPSPV